MAWARYALSSFLLPPNNTTLLNRKIAASTSSLSLTKPTKRKNYLRPKLLKTLTKPYLTPLLPEEISESPTNVCETLDIPQEQELEISRGRDLVETSGIFVVEEEEGKNEERKDLDSGNIHLSESVNGGVADVLRLVSSRSVLELALYVVGLFVVQTVCAVWVFGSVDLDKKSGNGKGKAELGIPRSELPNGVKDRGIKVLGKQLGSEDSQLEDRIVEIRAMAKEARESEANKLKNNSLVSSSDAIVDAGDNVVAGTAISRVKSSIQKEVDGRLVKLQKRFRSFQAKSPELSVTYLSEKVKDSKDSESLDFKEIGETLVSAKKHKFVKSPANLENKPKGFQGSKKSDGRKDERAATRDSSSRGKSNANNKLHLSFRERQQDVPDSNPPESTYVTMEKKESHLLEDKALEKTFSKALEIEEPERERFNNELDSSQALGRKLEKGGQSLKRGTRMQVDNAKPRAGSLQEISRGMPLTESKGPRESSELKTQISQSYTKEKQVTSTISAKQAPLNSNDSSTLLLQTREVENKPMVNKARDKRSDSKNDLWWLDLPFALAIFLRRGSDHKGPGGLYTLKINSHPQVKNCSSYTVAFEDRSDATNFCYLLESFFEDLGDVSADIVPLPTKELDEAVKSNSMKVIVVRKGQLQLYAGKPLADVEMALQSLVE